MPSRADHTGHGEQAFPSNGKNVWTKDTKIKTGKCRICGQKIDHWSWKCSLCKKAICSECCKPDQSGADFYGQSAQDQVEHGCNCTRFESNVNPALKHLMGARPPRQDEQMARDAAAKQKAIKTSARKKAAAAANPEEGPSSRSGRRTGRTRRAPSGDEDDLFDAGDASPSVRTARDRAARHAAQYREDDSVADEEEDNVNDDYDPPSRPTTAGASEYTASSARAQGRKRKPSQAGLEQDDFGSGPRKVRATVTQNRLEDGRTIIVGAGIIGLFAANELATRCRGAEIDHEIIVIEIRGDVCELASGQCAGFITSQGMSDDDAWLDLRREAAKVWSSLKARVGDPRQFGMIRDVSWSAQPIGDGNDEGIQMPRWFKPDPIYYVGKDERTSARLDPTTLARWLYDECRSLGVSFGFNRSPVGVDTLADGTHDVEIRKTSFKNGKPSKGKTVNCNNLVFAAGPFTTFLVKDLFNDEHQMGLGNTTSQYLWMDAPLQFSHPGAETGITVRTTRDVDNWSTKTMSMAVRPSSGSIRVSAAERAFHKYNVEPREALHPRQVSEDALRDLSENFLGVKGRDQVEVDEAGSAMVSVARNKRPYIDTLWVPRRNSRGSIEKPGVWLCYGFGAWGTTLAPGAARRLVDKMLGLQ